MILMFIIQLLNQMGDTHSSARHNNTSELQQNNWIEAVEDPSAIFSKVNPFRKRLLVNKMNNELIEQYELQFMSQEDFKMFISEIELRKESSQKIEMRSVDENVLFRTSPFIYRIKYFVNTSVQELCSTIYHGYLYIPKVELRLKQINDIPFEDVLYLYKSCLEGFKALYQHYGSFSINEQMIFFDKKGKVKVWINPNLSKNYPNFEKYHDENEYKTTIEVKDSQHDMIHQIVNLIHQNTDEIQNDHQLHFKQYLNRKINNNNQLTFYKVLELFYHYIQDCKLSLSTHLKSIYDLYHEQNDHVDINHSISNKNDISKIHLRQEDEKVQGGVELLKLNSSQDKGYSSKYGNVSKFPHKNHLQESRASKRSYNSEFNMRIGENQPKLQLLAIKRQDNNLYLSQKSSQVSNYEKVHHYYQQYPVANPPSEAVHRNIMTFCPPESRVIHHPTIKPQIAKYKSLQKYPQLLPAFNESKSITFSYQSKNTIPQINEINRPINITSNKESFQVKVPKRQSFIEKLNYNSQANTVKISNHNPFQENMNRQLNELKDTKKVNYFSTSQAYILDKQIAEDMQKYLGFNPNQI